MKANQEIFKDVLMVNIQDTANISLIRISRLEARFHDKKIFISLTLLEKPAQIGPVSKPSVEKNLNDAYESLKKAIINKILRITLVLGNAQVFFFLYLCNYTKNYQKKFFFLTKFVTAVSITDSFTDLDQNDGRNNLIPVLV